MSVIKVKNNGKWETIPIIGSTSGSGVGKVDSNSDGTGEIFNNYKNNQASGNYSHAEGYYTISAGTNSHVEGENNYALGRNSHVEGGSINNETISSVVFSSETKTVHGYKYVCSKDIPSAFKFGEKIYNVISHYTESNKNYVIILNKFETLDEEVTITLIRNYSCVSSSHVEGYRCTALQVNDDFESSIYLGSHAEGYLTESCGEYGSHSEGSKTVASGKGSHAEGYGTIASGNYSHSEGSVTKSSGNYSHAEGNGTISSGSYSHAEGLNSKSTNEASHAEGKRTLSIGNGSHAEGLDTSSSGEGSHSEGQLTIASGNASHSEGYQTKSTGTYSHAEGYKSNSIGLYSHSENNLSVSLGEASHSEGFNTLSKGDKSHSENELCLALGKGSHAEGYGTIASGNYSHAEGYFYNPNSTSDPDNPYTIISNTLKIISINEEDLSITCNRSFENYIGYIIRFDGDENKDVYEITGYEYISDSERKVKLDKLPSLEIDSITTYYLYHEDYNNASGFASHTEGTKTNASGNSSHAEGFSSKASGNYSHAECYSNRASGESSHAEGRASTALGKYSHVEGFSNITESTADNSHAEGNSTITYGVSSHAEGYYTRTHGSYSHSEGTINDSIGIASHTEGGNNHSLGNYSHSEGMFVNSNGDNSHAEGYYTMSEGDNSHVEGNNSRSIGTNSHAEGLYTLAIGANSHSEGGAKPNKNDLNISSINSDTSTITINRNLESNITPLTNKYIVFSGNDRYYYITGITSTSLTLDTVEGITEGVVNYTIYLNVSKGLASHSESLSTASGDYSHSEGYYTLANGEYSHAEGFNTRAIGISSHTEGYDNTSKGWYSHSEGHNNISGGEASHVEGKSNSASGTYSHSEGWDNSAYGEASHAEGYQTKSTGAYSHSEGHGTTSIGAKSHAEGQLSRSIGDQSHAEGYQTLAIGNYSHAEGGGAVRLNESFYSKTKDEIYAEWERLYKTPTVYETGDGFLCAAGKGSHSEGKNTLALADFSHSGGEATVTKTYAQTAIGIFNSPSTSSYNSFSSNGEAFVIGNGTSINSRGNAFKVLFNGQTYADGAYSGSGADYAEFFEWKDGNISNEDRVGLFVSLEGDKIIKANSNSSYVLGVVSGNPTIIGDNPMRWKNKYLTDEWGRPIYEDVEVKYTETEVDENGETSRVEKTRIDHVMKINPEWDSSLEYKSREVRPEWSAIGMMGKLLVRQDGTLNAGEFCYPNADGIATKSESGYYVMKVMSENQALILFK